MSGEGDGNRLRNPNGLLLVLNCLFGDARLPPFLGRHNKDKA